MIWITVDHVGAGPEGNVVGLPARGRGESESRGIESLVSGVRLLNRKANYVSGEGFAFVDRECNKRTVSSPPNSVQTQMRPEWQE